jgi:hypothetical protein
MRVSSACVLGFLCSDREVRYDPTNDGSLQYKGSKAIHDAGITSCVCVQLELFFFFLCYRRYYCTLTRLRYDSSQCCLYTAGFDNVVKCFLDEPQASLTSCSNRFVVYFHSQASMIPVWTCKTSAPPVRLATIAGSQQLLCAPPPPPHFSRRRLIIAFSAQHVLAFSPGHSVSLAFSRCTSVCRFIVLKGAAPMILDQRLGEDFTSFQLGALSRATAQRLCRSCDAVALQSLEWPWLHTSSRLRTAKKSLCALTFSRQFAAPFCIILIIFVVKQFFPSDLP